MVALVEQKGTAEPHMPHHDASSAGLGPQPSLAVLDEPPELLARHHDLAERCIHHGLAGVPRRDPGRRTAAELAAAQQRQQHNAPVMHARGRRAHVSSYSAWLRAEQQHARLHVCPARPRHWRSLRSSLNLETIGVRRTGHLQIASWLSSMYCSRTRMSRRRCRKLECLHSCAAAFAASTRR